MTAFLSEAIEVIKWIAPFLVMGVFGVCLFLGVFGSVQHYTRIYPRLRIWTGIALGVFYAAISLPVGLFFVAKLLDPANGFPWWIQAALASALVVAIFGLAITQALEIKIQTLDDELSDASAERNNYKRERDTYEYKYRDLRRQTYPDPESEWEEQILQQLQSRDQKVRDKDQTIREARDEIQTLKKQLDDKEDELEKANDHLGDVLLAISEIQRMSDVQIKPISTPSPWVVFDIADALEEAEERKDISASPEPQEALESAQRKLPAPETRETEDQTYSEDEIAQIWSILDETD